MSPLGLEVGAGVVEPAVGSSVGLVCWDVTVCPPSGVPLSPVLGMGFRCRLFLLITFVGVSIT